MSGVRRMLSRLGGRCPSRPVFLRNRTDIRDGRKRVKMEVEMVAKKTRGKPKPNKVYYAPNQAAMRLIRWPYSLRPPML